MLKDLLRFLLIDLGIGTFKSFQLAIHFQVVYIVYSVWFKRFKCSFYKIMKPSGAISPLGKHLFSNYKKLNVIFWP